MSGFNFGQIGNIISELFDTDYIDIKRDVSGQLQEIYSNIPCHIAFASTDNPNPETVDIKPIIQSVNVHMPLWVDIRNNDFLIAKRMDNSGNLLISYSGRCGNPVVSQGRQKVSMTMNATESEEPTPPPPINPIKIRINFLSNEVPIENSIERMVEAGSSFAMNAPSIEGYNAEYCVIDGEAKESSYAYIADVGNEEHEVNFVYSVLSVPTALRFLVNGLYTKDDGSLANGYHLYKKVDIDSISENEGVYTITCDNVKWVHEDNGMPLSIGVGTKLVLEVGNIFVKVNEIFGTENGKITFTASEYTPTEAEREAYVTGWYD